MQTLQLFFLSFMSFTLCIFQNKCRLHKNLVRGFLKNANLLLRSGGEIHITHKTKHPYTLWDIKLLGNEEGLFCVGEVDFNQALYPGYSNKRGSGSSCDRTFIVGQCSTFKFSADYSL